MFSMTITLGRQYASLSLKFQQRSVTCIGSDWLLESVPWLWVWVMLTDLLAGDKP